MKLGKVQKELLDLLARGPRYGFTRWRVVDALVERGLARKLKNGDVQITAKGKKLTTPPRKFDQSTSWNEPSFVEAFRVTP